MKGNRYKITEDNAAAGMVAEPTPVVRPPLSVQEMRHCLMDVIYSSKDIDKLYTCLGKFSIEVQKSEGVSGLIIYT